MNELLLLALILSAIIGTPGPNNTILLFSGLNNGYKKSLNLLFAINFGVVSMVTISTIFVSFISSLFAIVENYLLLFSTVLLFYISFRLWPKKTDDLTKPMNIPNISMLFFQFANPKIWLAGITVASSFKDQLSIYSISLLTAIVGLSLNSLWILLGCSMKKMQLKISNKSIAKTGSIILFLCALFFLISNFF